MQHAAPRHDAEQVASRPHDKADHMSVTSAAAQVMAAPAGVTVASRDRARGRVAAPSPDTALRVAASSRTLDAPGSGSSHGTMATPTTASSSLQPDRRVPSGASLAFSEATAATPALASAGTAGTAVTGSREVAGAKRARRHLHAAGTAAGAGALVSEAMVGCPASRDSLALHTTFTAACVAAAPTAAGPYTGELQELPAGNPHVRAVVPGGNPRPRGCGDTGAGARRDHGQRGLASAG